MILIVTMSQCNLKGPRKRKREAEGPESEGAGKCRAAGLNNGKGPQP